MVQQAMPSIYFSCLVCLKLPFHGLPFQSSGRLSLTTYQVETILSPPCLLLTFFPPIQAGNLPPFWLPHWATCSATLSGARASMSLCG